MRKILIAVDGSPQSDAAAAHIAAGTAPGASELHLVNVQRPLDAYVARFLHGSDRRDFHREQGQRAVARAEHILKRGGHRPLTHIYVGEPGTTLARAANALGVEEIVVGADGLGPLGRFMFRNFLSRLMQRAEAPVMVIKHAKPVPQTESGAWPQTYPAAAMDESLALRR